MRLKTTLDLKGYQKADIFSFGVIIWEIIHRQIPWNDSTLEEIEFSIRFLLFLLFYPQKEKRKKKR